MLFFDPFLHRCADARILRRALPHAAVRSGCDDDSSQLGASTTSQQDCHTVVLTPRLHGISFPRSGDSASNGAAKRLSFGGGALSEQTLMNRRIELIAISFGALTYCRLSFSHQET